MRKTITLAILLVITSNLSAEEWPGWRGPRLDGTSQETEVPVHWSGQENIAWKAYVPGIGHSSPVVWGDKVFLTSCLLKEKHRLLLCYDRKSRSKLWEKLVVTAPLEKKHKLNSFASSTPATDGEFVYVTFLAEPNILVACYDFQGKKIWEKSPGKFISPHGFCSTPVLYKNLLIINCDQDARFAKDPKEKSFIVALDKKTGQEVWRIEDRPFQIRSYCVPLIVEAGGKMQLVLSGTKCVTSYEPDTGKLIWKIDGPTEQFVASPVYGSGLFFLTAGFPDFHNMAIRPDGTGNITKSHVVWHEDKVAARKASYVPSPIAHGKFFYVVSDLGFVSCFEAKTGKRQFMEQLGQHHSASPVSANGLLYFLDDDGDTYVLKAGPRFELVAKNSLGEECYGSPAISRGQILIRSLNHLYCIGKKNSLK